MEATVDRRLQEYPVVVIEGPRQSGKTTLVKRFAGKVGNYHSCDDRELLANIENHGDGFLASLGSRAVLDEIQEWPRCMNAIKRLVDDRPGNGQFLITGSSSLSALQKEGDSLAGRACFLTLLPLCQAEIQAGSGDFFLDYLFGDRQDAPELLIREGDLNQAVAWGGYPRLLRCGSSRQRAGWLRNYCLAMARRDIPALAQLRTKVALRNVLRSLASSATGNFNVQEHGRRLGINHATAGKIIGILQELNIVSLLGRYSPGEGIFSHRHRQMHFSDSGMLAAILGLSELVTGRHLRSDRLAGALFETFVFSEIAKLGNAADAGHSIGYWSDQSAEVDFVLQLEGRIVGVEAKSASMMRPDFFRGLRRLARQADNMHRGIVVYSGSRFFSDVFKTGHGEVIMQAIPVSWLWGCVVGEHPVLF